MVCVPCVIAPVVLLIWRFLIQPLLLRFWNFRQKVKTDDGKPAEEPPQLIKECNEGGCVLKWGRTQKAAKVD